MKTIEKTAPRDFNGRKIKDGDVISFKLKNGKDCDCKVYKKGRVYRVRCFLFDIFLPDLLLLKQCFVKDNKNA